MVEFRQMEVEFLASRLDVKFSFVGQEDFFWLSQAEFHISTASLFPPTHFVHFKVDQLWKKNMCYMTVKTFSIFGNEADMARCIVSAKLRFFCHLCKPGILFFIFFLLLWFSFFFLQLRMRGFQCHLLGEFFGSRKWKLAIWKGMREAISGRLQTRHGFVFAASVTTRL